MARIFADARDESTDGVLERMRFRRSDVGMTVLHSHLRRGWAEMFFSLRVEIVEAGDVRFTVHLLERSGLDDVARLHAFRQKAMACDTQVCDGRVDKVPSSTKETVLSDGVVARRVG